MEKQGVARTALFVAAVRARENERHDPLFRDDLSSLLAGPEGKAWLAKSEADPSSNYHKDSFPYLEVRTRYFDDWSMQAVRDSKARQVVLLGAGMDTRAFRLPWPKGLKIWEVDTPALFSLKEPRLGSAGVRPSIERIVVEADLTSKRWAASLLAKGLDEGEHTVWLAEGIFEYLSAADVGQILEGAESVSPLGSHIGAEIISEDYIHRGSSQRALKRRKERGTPWRFGTNDPESLFGSHGWVVDRNVRALDAAVALARWPPPTKRPAVASGVGAPSAAFVTAARRA